MLPTEENLIETMYKDTINRNKDIVYFYNILQAQESASTIAIDGRWGSGKTFFVCQTKLVINALNPSCDMDEEEKAKVTIRLPFPKNNEENENCSIAVYYDAWENDNDTEPVLSLIYEITKQLSVDFSLSDKSIVKTAGAIIEAISGHNDNGFDLTKQIRKSLVVSFSVLLPILLLIGSNNMLHSALIHHNL